MAFSKIIAESMDLTDTYAFTGTVTGAGQTNQPSFQARSSTNVSCADNTYVKLTFDTEDFDTDSKFDLANDRFTPTIAGKYFIYGKVYEPFNSPDVDNVSAAIYKNGSYASGGIATWVHRNVQTGLTCVVLDLDTDDYVELYTRQGSGQTLNLQGNLFGAYKLF